MAIARAALPTTPVGSDLYLTSLFPVFRSEEMYGNYRISAAGHAGDDNAGSEKYANGSVRTRVTSLGLRFSPVYALARSPIVFANIVSIRDGKSVVMASNAAQCVFGAALNPVCQNNEQHVSARISAAKSSSQSPAFSVNSLFATSPVANWDSSPARDVRQRSRRDGRY